MIDVTVQYGCGHERVMRLDPGTDRTKSLLALARRGLCPTCRETERRRKATNRFIHDGRPIDPEIRRVRLPDGRRGRFEQR